jgi:NADPH:quinone reductase-like Zn-dependent oxidoreductase
MVRKRVNIPLPAIPGGDLSGVIEQAGSRVEGWSAGQPVFALIGLMGSYAEYVAIDPSFVAPKPTSIDYVSAASVPLAGLTAYQALFELGGLKAGQRVLVHAAAGGVGGFAVQLARSAGAEVVGTASAANADYVRGLGATDVIDYRNPDYDRYRASFDLVFDLVGGDATTQSLTALRNGGALVGALCPSAMRSASRPRRPVFERSASGASRRQAAPRDRCTDRGGQGPNDDRRRVSDRIGRSGARSEQDRAHARQDRVGVPVVRNEP